MIFGICDYLMIYRYLVFSIYVNIQTYRKKPNKWRTKRQGTPGTWQICTDIFTILIDGLVEDCSISSALAMEILQSCTKPSIYDECTHILLNNQNVFLYILYLRLVFRENALLPVKLWDFLYFFRLSLTQTSFGYLELFPADPWTLFNVAIPLWISIKAGWSIIFLLRS